MGFVPVSELFLPPETAGKQDFKRQIKTWERGEARRCDWLQLRLRRRTQAWDWSREATLADGC